MDSMEGREVGREEEGMEGVEEGGREGHDDNKGGERISEALRGD